MQKSLSFHISTFPIKYLGVPVGPFFSILHICDWGQICEKMETQNFFQTTHVIHVIKFHLCKIKYIKSLNNGNRVLVTLQKFLLHNLFKARKIYLSTHLGGMKRKNLVHGLYYSAYC
jgi:hypothetical protein